MAANRPDSLTWILNSEEEQSMILEGPNSTHTFRFRENTGVSANWIILKGVEVAMEDQGTESLWFYKNVDGTQLRKICEYLINVYNPRALHAVVKFAAPVNFFVFEHPRELQSLRVQRDLGGLRVSPEDLKIFCEDVKASSLSMTVCVDDPEFRYTTGIKNETVDISYPDWLHLDAILNSETRIFVFNQANQWSSDLNAILMCWQSGGMPKLELLHFQGSRRSYPAGHCDEVLNGIKFTDWDPTRVTKFIRINGKVERFDAGKEVVREDGKRGIVAVKPNTFHPFKFTVFSENDLVREEETTHPECRQFGGQVQWC